MYGTINTEFYKTRGNVKYSERLERTEFRMPYFFFEELFSYMILVVKKTHFIEFQVTIRQERQLLDLWYYIYKDRISKHCPHFTQRNVRVFHTHVGNQKIIKTTAANYQVQIHVYVHFLKHTVA